MGVLRQNRGKGGAILTPQRTRSCFLGFLRLCQFWLKSIKKYDRESARRRTDTQTDANRFYNLSHAICYSYGTDNKNIPITFLEVIRSAWSGATVSFWLHPARCRFQLPTAAVYGRSHPRSYSEWSDVHGCLLSAIVHFRWLEAASGTVCRLTSPQLQRWLFFGTASKLISHLFADHFLLNCFWLSSVHRL